MYTARYATKDVSPVPPTLDDVADTLKTGKIFASEPVKDALRAVCRSKTIELFNFGPLELDVVREAQHEAVEFVMHEHFTTPYDACIYRSSIEYDNAKVGTLLVVVTGGVKLGVSPCHSGIAVVRVVKAIDTIFAMHCICTHKTQLTRDGRAIQMEIRQHELDFWRGHLPDEEETQWQLTEGALCMLGMTMILNTKGVLKERSAPPVKPNKVREKQGRPPLLYTTRVYTNVYNQSVAPGTGTHASPRPHRRRAHVRHYPATATREGYSLPIAAMLVNWDGRPLEARAEYKVK